MKTQRRNLNWYSTTQDVIKELNVRADGKIAIVTGANAGTYLSILNFQGIGIETARSFAEIGAHVILG
jgi:hypothetical protein